jgi:PAS domain S-box-containing protein
MVDLLFVSRVLLLVAGGTMLALAVRTDREQGTPVAQSFAGLLGLLGITAVCTSVTATGSWPNKVIWLHTNLLIPLALLAFGLDYYGLSAFSSPRTLALLGLPAALGSIGGTTLIFGTTRKLPRMEPPAESLATLPDWAFGLAGTLNRIGYYYTLLVIGVALVLVFRNVTRYDHLDTRLGVVIAFIGVWPWVGNFLFPELNSQYGLLAGQGVLAAGYSISAAVAVLVVGPLGLFGSLPAAGNVGPRTVLDSMDDPVLMVDDREQLLRFNDAAGATFGLRESETVGRRLDDVLGKGAEQLQSGDVVSLETVSGTRQFEVSASRVTDRWGGERGAVLVLADVTGRLTREQRLEVLNRVLRHNLRNSATSIIARAELIGDGGTEESAAEIIESTKSLVGTAERAREIEEMMTAANRDETTQLGESVHRVVDQIDTQYPDVEFTVGLPEAVTVAASPEVVETVLHNVVENGAQHNDAESPIVVVSADGTGGGAIDVAVADNGPGIPEHERRVLDAGEENQLQHGSGLGLWGAYWGMTQIGGDLAIADNQPRGSIVTMTLPVADTGAERPGQSAVPGV